jgi:hypothetical protein
VSETALQFLIHPQLCVSSSHSLSHPCAIIGFGCLLIRSDALSITYSVGECEGGIRGEDIGFSVSLMMMGDSEYVPHFLCGHVVEHLNGGKTDNPYIPFITTNSVESKSTNASIESSSSSSSNQSAHDNNTAAVPMLSHIRRSQLFNLLHRVPMTWQCFDQDSVSVNSKSTASNVISLTVQQSLPALPSNYAQIMRSMQQEIGAHAGGSKGLDLHPG